MRISGFPWLYWAMAGLISCSGNSLMGAEKPTPSPTSAQYIVVYKPPARGAPTTRLSGGTRSLAKADLFVYVLAPKHTGLTTREQPSLFWYISKPIPAKIEITVTDELTDEPLLKTTVDGIATSGIQALNLADYGARMKLGVEYQWSVAVVPEPGQRTRDIAANGGIKRVKSSAKLTALLRGASKQARVSIFAQEGIWYDALASLSEVIEAEPRNQVLRNARVRLLEQVGLSGIKD